MYPWACADEFDKISSDHQALLGAMEQQVGRAQLGCRTNNAVAAVPHGCTSMLHTISLASDLQEVSVAKAGMVASLPARTTVLAAANPVEGSYNKGKTLLVSSCLSSRSLCWLCCAACCSRARAVW